MMKVEIENSTVEPEELALIGRVYVGGETLMLAEFSVADEATEASAPNSQQPWRCLTQSTQPAC